MTNKKGSVVLEIPVKLEIEKRLRHQAQKHGRTLEEELQRILDRALPPEAPADLWEQIAAFRRATAHRRHAPAEDLIRAQRDES